VPGPPGGVLDLAALAEIEDRLRRLADASVADAARAGGLDQRAADRRRSLTTAASSVAAVLWFDALRAEDHVSVTPDAGPLLAAVHEVLDAARPADATGLVTANGRDLSADSLDGLDPSVELSGPGDGAAARWGLVRRTDRAGGALAGAAGGLGPPRLPIPAGRSARSLRAAGAGTVGPGSTIWNALARRFAGTRFDPSPGGRIICILEYPELRDAALWEAVTDERTPYLGELLWVVLVSGAAVGAHAEGQPPAGLGGPGGPDRAARMFEAAGWQVLTLRFGRRLHALFRRPGGQALRARLSRMSQDEYRELLVTHGPELHRRLAGPGAAGVGISGLLELLGDAGIHAALRDLGGHDLALLIDAVDEVAADRPTVLFAHTHDAWTRGPVGQHGLSGPWPGRTPAVGITSIRPMGAGPAAVVLPARVPGPYGRPAPAAGTRGARLATHVASYLDRAHHPAAAPPPVPADLDLGSGVLTEVGLAGPGIDGASAVSSTQAAFGALLRGLASLTPEVVGALVTVSTQDADGVVASWLDPRPGAPEAGPPAGPGTTGAGDPGAAVATASTERRHIAGALAPGAFTGVLGNLGVAWNRQGLPLLPVGVTDELAAGRVVPAWATGCAADARSVIAVADTSADPRFAGPALAVTGGAGLPGVTRYEPAFAQDLAWCVLAALGRLGRADGSSSLLRLSARPVDQRAAAVPATGPARARRHACVLAGGYRLRDGGPSPAVTLVGMGTVLPEVLQAADELTAELATGVGVVVATSADLLFAAARDREAHGPDAGWVLAELFPAHRRAPLVTVVDGDPRQLAFLAGIHGDRLAALGRTTTVGPIRPTVPVETDAIVAAARTLLSQRTPASPPPQGAPPTHPATHPITAITAITATTATTATTAAVQAADATPPPDRA
jgi:pyruvate dehydrogenase E1 component